MSVSVRVPTILRTYTGGESEVSAEGSTVGEVLDGLEANHSGIRERVLDDPGALRRFVNVYVDNDDVRFPEALGTAVADGGQISIIPAVAGGCEAQLRARLCSRSRARTASASGTTVLALPNPCGGMLP